MTERAALAWCPLPDVHAARSIARTVIAEQLAACANIVPGVESVFVWEGEVQTSHEVGALFKTDAERLAQLIARLAELHPYAVPAIVGWQCDAAAPATLGWLGEVLAQP